MLQGEFNPFYEKPKFSVIKSTRNPDIIRPRTEVTANEGLQIALTVAGKGYYGGDIEKVFNARGDFVIDTYFYIQFLNDYEIEVHNLNKKEIK